MMESIGRRFDNQSRARPLFLAVLLFSVSGCARASEVSFDDQWVSWCLQAKQELMADGTVAGNAVFVKDHIASHPVVMASFDGLLLPLPQQEILERLTTRDSQGGYQLILEFESGLSIRGHYFQRELLGDVLSYFVVDLPAPVQAYIEEHSEEFQDSIEQWLNTPPDEITLRMAGFRSGPDDLQCTPDSIKKDLRTYVALLTVLGMGIDSDSHAERKAFWSENAFDGIVTREASRLALGGRPPRVYWLGEFYKGPMAYRVIISFPSHLADKYDYLGPLLAKPQASGLESEGVSGSNAQTQPDWPVPR